MLTRASSVVRCTPSVVTAIAVRPVTVSCMATDAKAAPIHRPRAVAKKFRGVSKWTLAERAALQKRELDRLRTTEVPWPGNHPSKSWCVRSSQRTNMACCCDNRCEATRNHCITQQQGFTSHGIFILHHCRYLLTRCWQLHTNVIGVLYRMVMMMMNNRIMPR